jgi:hypothetical protein
MSPSIRSTSRILEEVLVIATLLSAGAGALRAGDSVPLPSPPPRLLLQSASIPGQYGESSSFTLDTNRIGFAESQVVTSATPLARPTELGDPRPNPFNPTVTIPFTVARSASCRLRIYDTAGRLVTTLRDGLVGAGEHRVTWDGRDTSQRPVASGVYFVEFVTPQARQIRKIALTK